MLNVSNWDDSKFIFKKALEGFPEGVGFAEGGGFSLVN
jgi:hypothetical protein